MKILKYIINISIWAFVCIQVVYISSCANTKGAPSGGPKDTLAPIVLSIIPDSNAILVPTQKTKITINFNEYIQVKDAAKNITLSPPQSKRPVTKIKGKSLVVTFPKDLDSSKTYSLNFGSAIADNNEGNILQNFVYSFSTGRHIDSMLVSGVVLDNSKLLPMEGVTIALYENPKDSSVITTLPDAVARSDKWGYFTVRNLKPVPYGVFAFTDANGNNKYDPGVENIGFVDTLITPTVVMKKGMPQLASYDMKDTTNCLLRPHEFDIIVFKEKPSVQYIKEYKRTSNKSSYISFNAPDVIIDSFSIRGIRQDKILKQFNNTNDSLIFWVNEPSKLADTLFLGLKYHKTDSLGVLTPTVENLKLVAPIEKKESRKKQDNQGVKERKDLLKFNLIAKPELIEQYGFIFEFPDPLVKMEFDSIRLTSTTPRKVVTQEKFLIENDTIDFRKFSLKPITPFKKGNDYELFIPEKIFRDINGFTNDTIENKIFLPIDDKLSSLTTELKGVHAKYVIELVNEKRDQVFRQFTVAKDTTIVFPYIKEGSYSIRIFEDLNNNGIIDPGNLILRKQPEKVKLYRLPDGNNVIKIKERTDLEQTINIYNLFNNVTNEE